MDMLHRDKRIILYFILCFISFVGCNKHKTYNAKEINEIRDRSIAKAQSIIGEDEYWFIYNSAIDSINSWIDSEIGNFRYWRSLINYQLDSVFCVNKDGNKVVMSILLPYVATTGTSDQIQYFYGVKINSQWYFFVGATMVLPRKFYQEDVHTPLSFEKLKQIATWNIYRNYLRKNRQGEWEINDDFFNMMFPKNQVAGGFGSCFECETEEEYVLYLVHRKWEEHRREQQRAEENRRRTEIMERYNRSLQR